MQSTENMDAPITGILEHIEQLVTDPNGSVMTEVFSKIDMVGRAAYVMCGFFALFYICAKVWKQWVSGSGIDFYSLLRPFAIGLLVLNFSLVPTTIDVALSPINAAIESMNVSKRDELKQKREACEKRADDLAAEEERALEESMQKLNVLSKVSLFIDSVMNDMGNWIMEGLMSVLFWLMQMLTPLIKMILYIFVLVTKAILILLGPFVFALSIIPSFDSLIKQWITRYMNISLYIPMVGLVTYINSVLLIDCWFDAYMNVTAGGDAAYVAGMSTMFMLLGIIVGGACLVMYFFVPTFAGWIVDGQGAGSIGKSLLSGAMAIGVPLAAAKGASKVIGKGPQASGGGN